MSKYIIKNCPCYNNERFLSGFLDDKDTICTYYSKNCQDCTDCVLRRIVEKLRELEEKSIELSYCEFKQYVDEVFLIDVFYSNMLGIQEVE